MAYGTYDTCGSYMSFFPFKYKNEYMIEITLKLCQLEQNLNKVSVSEYT